MNARCTQLRFSKTAFIVAALSAFGTSCAKSDEASDADVAADTGSDDTTDDASSDVTDEPDNGSGDTGDGDAPPVIACGSDSPEALAACVVAEQWMDIVEAVAVVRPTGSPGWQSVQDRCADTLEAAGFDVVRDNYGSGVNVVGTLRGTEAPDEIVLVSAHYDHVDSINADGELCLGADDNASGVASALELARILATTDHRRTLMVACWDEEERGLIGSTSWAERAAIDGRRFVVNLNFEMVGYFTDEPNTQNFPAGFGLFFPEVEAAVDAREGRGDFLALVGDASAAPVMDALVAWSANTEVDHIKVEVPADLTNAVSLADLRRSDHSPFWDTGVPAIMLTDSSEFRNPHYHCPPGFPDTPETLNPVAAAEALKTVVAVTAILLEGDEPPAAPGVAPACDPLDDVCTGETACSYTAEAARNGIAACTPIGGDVAAGEICERIDGEVGFDNCVAGTFCALYGVPVDGDGNFVRRCLPWCDESTDCGEGGICRRINAFVPAGVCVESCDPFGDACGDGLVCSHTPPFDQIALPWSCNQTPDGFREGSACSSVYDCGNGLGCAPGLATCQPLCSTENPCEDGATCVPWAVPTAIEGFGTCVAE